MSGWTEEDSRIYREIAAIAVPRRAELIAALVSRVPFDAAQPFRAVDLGCGDGVLADAILERFPKATVLGLDGSPSMREAAIARTARFGERVTIRSFDLASLDWWDLMLGADVVASTLALHHLSDSKKQYLYKAVAERVAAGGAFLIADLAAPASSSARSVAAEEWDQSAKDEAEALGRPQLYARFVEVEWNVYRFPDLTDQPSAILHHLVWLKHAGFSAVDCFWMFAGHAVFGGFR